VTSDLEYRALVAAMTTVEMPPRLIELKGEALQHWIEDLMRWPRGSCDRSTLVHTSFRDHPLLKLVRETR
jgi:hypothetical protein